MRQSLVKFLRRRTAGYFDGLNDVLQAIRQLDYGGRLRRFVGNGSIRAWQPTRSVPFGVAIGLISIITFTAVAPLTVAQTNQGGDCDDNAVIRCGVSDLNDLKTKYRENQQDNVQAVFAAFGIPNEAALDGMVPGRITGNNEVYVGERLVATGATTAGRQNISNERGSSVDMGGGFWQRSPSVSFTDPNGSLDALVKMENNTFKHAVIMSCGNPVGATPEEETPPPAPQPTPTPPPPAQPPPPPATPPTPPSPPSTPPSPQFEINKDVRIKGETQWRQNVTVDDEDDDRLEYRITVRNTGQTELEDVVITDRPPSGVSHTDLQLETTDQPAGELFTSGITVDSIATGQEEEIIYELLINPSTEACGSSRLRNVVTAKPDNAPEKQDDATAEICREDEEEEEEAPPPVTPAVTPPAPVLAATTTKTTTLPDTGPGSLIALFGIASFGGSLAHYYLFARRRL